MIDGNQTKNKTSSFLRLTNSIHIYIYMIIVIVMENEKQQKCKIETKYEN